MSRMGFFFGDGDSFLYDGPLSWERLNMPPGIEDVFKGLHTVIDLYHMAFGSRGAYYLSFIRNDGNVKYVDDVVHANLPPNLLRFLQPTTKEMYSPLLETTVRTPSIARSISDTAVWLGPKNSYFIQDVQTLSWQYDGLPAGLVDAMKTYNSNNSRTNHIRLLTLGYRGSYFAAWQDGSFAYDLVACSKALDDMLDELLEIKDRGNSRAGIKGRAGVQDIEYISISSFHPNRWIIFFKDGTYFCSLPPTWHVLCAPISATNAAFLKKQYPEAKPLSPSTRREIVSQLIQTVTEQTLVTIFTTPDSNPTTSVDPNTGSSSYAPDPGASESAFHSNVTDTGGLDFGAGESVVAAHGLAGVTDSGTTANTSNSTDNGTGTSRFDGGGDGGGGIGAAAGYPGGDGGGGAGGGAVGGWGF